METSTSTTSISTEVSISNSSIIIIEKDVIGTVVSVNKLKHYAFIKRIDNHEQQDVFARDVSIIKNERKPIFLISDRCKFDIKKTTRGFEAINISIIQRTDLPISKFKKIPKKKIQDQQKTEESLQLLKSSIIDLLREALK
ncbi:unnamed protein product [Rotaria socialis]|uniref:Uncharacterized protein n=1 Tax=Rotaria socialis TaxID=392032 RepID=A0A820Z513_9BILA|nr:unnamed protein product [Rotaria socialis]CAF3786082.1 unnamed protein product [Rotaria socialis]CAF4502982.1 unnamed protein product [Rotaria socialis]CAF4559355.1 unnamed protein product [Rotaria socialis]CAF4577641.1 unnamed protein product [Rotaria socialis]